MTGGTFRPAVEPPLCCVGWDIEVSWTSREDGGPTIRLTYRIVEIPVQVGRRSTSRAVVRFRQVLLIRYHNEHLQLGDEEADYVRDFRYPWLLWRGEGTPLLDEVADKLVTGGGDWFGTPARELHHYRIGMDHDGYYDVICTGMDLSTEPIDPDEAGQ